ncbi:hypothetical protein HMPREF0880_01051 [Yokenella regensburgei ATCC 43003]|nr:hypothetical protein HMPREF0880_01051 [Yokenella regensburgei ATCC 43003]
MHTNLPAPECHISDLLISRNICGYINASGLPLYYRAFVYKLPK